MFYPDPFDVIIIGGGHAGTEAAMAAARMGQQTLLLTHNIDTLGQMSCNPAIGGIGKGHLVKEVDALGCLMAKAIDQAGIQFRILNASKGPAVRATRAQADRVLYRQAVRTALENQPNLMIFQQAVEDLIVENDRVVGAVTQMGLKFRAKAVVLTVGTFLDGKIHIGLDNYSGGRAGDPPSIPLSRRLRELPLRVGRLKTGTPPRIDARTIDFSVLAQQHGDNPMPVFSFMGNASQHPQQVPCYITHTNEKTHDVIRSNLDRSPMYAGVIEGVGPRYCPSIEDKVMRFADRNQHQIFLEPEGLTSNEIYPNGISTSLPFDVQMQIVRSMQGMENAKIVRPEAHFTLLDSLGKRVRFLRQVQHELKLENIEPVQSRVEEFPSEPPFDGVISRAFASLNDMVSWCHHLPGEQGRFYALKGQMPEDEIALLPEEYQVESVVKLQVPALDGERHLVVIKANKI